MYNKSLHTLILYIKQARLKLTKNADLQFDLNNAFETDVNQHNELPTAYSPHRLPVGRDFLQSRKHWPSTSGRQDVAPRPNPQGRALFARLNRSSAAGHSWPRPIFKRRRVGDQMEI